MDKKKILIVDDEKDFGQMVKLNLEKGGEYDVRVESVPGYAIETAKYFKPDLIFLDIVMPDLDGMSVFNQLQDEDDLRGIPVVFLTAIMSQEEVARCKGVASEHIVLAKPIKLDKLIECIKNNT
ncbi:MAG: response regulator [Candidatus Omnitrophica bacterium]|jgi:CheY-like chemotaxis protein|nr:response regulator [Candidatus Omnitrophota bacterium]MDD4908838.1 response regulator [Candidatus Omnitrophota bacterium]